MKCPRCLNDLVRGKDECYATLEEHVCCEESSIRSTWVCQKGCYGADQFFGEDGSLYGHGNAFGSALFALDSQARKIEISLLLQEVSKGSEHIERLETMRIESVFDIPPHNKLVSLVGRLYSAI